MKRILLCSVFLLACLPLRSQQALTRKFSGEQSLGIFNDIVESFEKYHPGYYRYHGAEDWKRYIDSLRPTIGDSLTELELYRKLKPLVVRIGCLHTDLITAVNYKGYLDRDANLVPLRLHFEQDRAYVIRNYSNDSLVQPGDEVLDINGKPIASVIRTLLAAIPSDGYNLTMKYLALDHMFPSCYRSMIEIADSFNITFLHEGKVVQRRLAAAKHATMAGKGFLEEFAYPRQLELKIQDSIACLTVHSFANSAIRKGGQQFREYMDQAFRDLKAKGIPYLILDLRYNTGGSDPNAACMASYFFHRPFRYWDRIEVTPAIAKKTRGLARIWYHKPVQRDSVWLWQKAKRARDFDFYEIQQPAQDAYTGKVFVLINGFCMSSCADLTAILKYNHRAVFIGEETGGGYQGNNSGIMPGINLRPSKMVLTLPLQKYVNVVDTTAGYGRGTMPDHTVSPATRDLIEGKDPQMDFVLDLIRRSRSE